MTYFLVSSGRSDKGSIFGNLIFDRNVNMGGNTTYQHRQQYFIFHAVFYSSMLFANIITEKKERDKSNKTKSKGKKKTQS